MYKFNSNGKGGNKNIKQIKIIVECCASGKI
jgi:hypothetical protein